MNLDVHGAKILLEIPVKIPVLGNIMITETVVNTWIVMAVIVGHIAVCHGSPPATWGHTDKDILS